MMRDDGGRTGRKEVFEKVEEGWQEQGGRT